MVREPSQEPVALIAGGGRLPRCLADAAARCGRPVLVIRLEGEADDAFDGHISETLRYGQVGRLLSVLQDAQCRDVVMAGHVTRPSPEALRPDWGGLQRMPRILKAMIGGDDTVLRKVSALMEAEGLRLISPLDIAPDLAVSSGHLAGPDDDNSAYRHAIEAARTLGRMDAGQSAVVHGGRPVALEGLEGTDAMLERVMSLRGTRRWSAKGQSGVFGKAAKPQQDMRLDVPTVGLRTMELVVHAGLRGVALEAGRVLMMDRDEMLELANAQGVTVRGEGA